MRYDRSCILLSPHSFYRLSFPSSMSSAVHLCVCVYLIVTISAVPLRNSASHEVTEQPVSTPTSSPTIQNVLTPPNLRVRSRMMAAINRVSEVCWRVTGSIQEGPVVFPKQKKLTKSNKAELTPIETPRNSPTSTTVKPWMNNREPISVSCTICCTILSHSDSTNRRLCCETISPNELRRCPRPYHPWCRLCPSESA